MRKMLENYINGNISEARKQARRFGLTKIQNALIEEFGYSKKKALLTAYHIKTGEGWQEACDAD